ncbi:DNA gyrase subunit A [Caloramator quimbayensis]|uniref:DNA gyrase subunit A n=1 Tax=Caloramator quimbayensis TaxID=1147123 RepID=A0A1T4Y7B8_9CLOT|nr:DNA gyrase subunit A [Caloramator quimbayensis]SKA97418.1 DNA gyrase subunit A [Caloramator quimbayensis]
MEEINEKIQIVNINDEMKKCYIDYAMSVIVGRALPDVRDGLKPVHRRILYSMHELGLFPDKQYRKSARIVGDVLGKYHPHGDSAVYDAMVRLAQDFSTRYLLVDGHGNFGSVDGDGAAAMRYTEARLSKIAMEMMRDINKDTIDFVDNFDGSEKEPSVLPSRYPNLLVNGSSGIAVGMATNIPPHNLSEVIDGTIMLIDNPDVSIKELMTKIKGPDFPTAGVILGKDGIRQAYETGRGRIIVRAKAVIEEEKGKNKIIITEIPYQVNKAKLIEDIAELVKDKKIEGISDLRDESDRQGMRIVIELKRDANPNVVLNLLYKHTKMQDTFGVIMIALVDGEPKTLNLKEALIHYINFQKEVLTRRTRYELDKAEARAHILEGLRIALDHIDEVINLIRSSKTVEIARNGLMEKFGLSEKQAQAILDMRLQRLTGLEREKIEEEYAELIKTINYLREVLENERLLLSIIKDELNEIKQKYGDTRRTKIMSKFEEIDVEDLIQEEEVAVTITHAGYIKRITIDAYRSQKRGGKGIQGLSTREDDFVEHLFITSTHNNIIFFTNMGRAYKLKAYEIPEGGRTAKGTNIVNILPLNPREKIQAVISIKEFNEEEYLLFVTKNGLMKKTTLSEFSSIRKNGLNAINLRDSDELIGAKLTDGKQTIAVITQNGYSLTFNEEDVRPMGRTAAGVKAITLRENDIVVGAEIVDLEQDLLIVSENGYGKRTSYTEYPVHHRGGKGIITYKVTEKTGKIVGAKTVKDSDEIMLINNSNIIIRLEVNQISRSGRNTMGVTLMKTKEDERIVSVAKINSNDNEEENQ